MKIAMVAAAGFLLASPALAQGVMPGHAGMSAKDHAAMSTGSVQATGVVKEVNAKAGTVKLYHGPIAALKWPAMTMSFKAKPEVLKSAKKGQKVKFTLDAKGGEVLALQPN